MKPILVTGYVNPDLDGVAGAMAYCEFLKKTGKNAEVGILGEMHDEAKFIFDRYGFSYPQTILNADNYDEVILVDASDLVGLEGNIDPDKVIEIIDHRKINETDKFPKAKVQIEFVGSAATLVAEKFIQNNVDISDESAFLVCGAIISNTLNFRVGGIDIERDKKVFDFLNRKNLLPSGFWKELFLAKSDLSGNKLKERIEGDFAWFVIGGKKVGIAQLEIIGADNLIEERGREIVDILRNIKSEMGLDYIFQNTIELEEAKNILIAEDDETRVLLEKILEIKFNGSFAEKPNLIMRKQIVPLIKEELSKN